MSKNDKILSSRLSEYQQQAGRAVWRGVDGAVFTEGDILLRDSLKYLPDGAVLVKIDTRNDNARFMFITVERLNDA